MPHDPPADPEMGPWLAEAPRKVGAQAMLQGADYAVRRFTGFGLRMDDGNRLSHARDLVLAAERARPLLSAENPEVLRQLAQANSTLWDFYLIARAAAPTNGQPQSLCLDKITEALGAADRPKYEVDQHARDIQFELYAFAMLRIGGAEVSLAEPDLRLLYGKEFVGIAAKRLTSKQQLAQRIKDGVKQIQRVGGRGFVAANLDVFLTDLPIQGGQAARGLAAAKRFASLRAQLLKYRGTMSVGPHWVW